jgi:hypothetical protein
MTPEIVTASRVADATADIEYFDFADAANGFFKSRYDVLLLFGIDLDGIGGLPQDQVDAIARFMQAGGGLFATGDQESVESALNSNIPRVRSMRFLDDHSEEPASQRLCVNYRTRTGGVGRPHPLLQGGALGPIEVFPHLFQDGEAHIPDDLTTQFTLDGAARDEWPFAVGGRSRVAPEVVAFTMSHGDAITAYDGHSANVGRVVTDSIWQHFVNNNIGGLYGIAEAADAQRLRQFYRNIATWLMPKTVRKGRQFPFMIEELGKDPFIEDLRVPELEHATSGELRASA